MMNKYTKPTAQVVELSVKESISLLEKEETRNFGVGSASMTNSCIENTKWNHTSYEDVSFGNYSEDEQEWLDDDESMGMDLC